MIQGSDSIFYHPTLPFSAGDGKNQAFCVFSCQVKAGVLDLETGAQAGLGAFNDFFVETRDAGLCPAAGEILVSGVRPDANTAGFVQFFKGGEKRIIEKTLEACDSFVKEGLLVGHNIFGFDLPFLAVRAGVHGLAIPSWLSGAGRVLDTYKMFNRSGFSKFSTGMLSLQETAALWGRDPDGDSGANFGDLWRGGTDGQREALRHYNMLNLIDSLCIALHSGALGMPEGATTSPSRLLKWEDSGEYHYELPAVPETKPQTSFFHWITAPVPGLLANGPRKISGWGKTTADEAKNDYPRGSGRLDAGACMIVGFTSSDRAMLNTEGEAFAIEEGLRELRKLQKEEKPIYTEKPSVFKNYTCLRLSMSGGILPSWFGQDDFLYDDHVKGLGEDGLVALGLGLGGRDMRIPSFCGQDKEEFLATAVNIATHRANTAHFFSRA